MRNIAVIGAGQAGLQLAFGLLARGYRVTLYSDKTAEQIFNSRLWGTPFLFQESCEYERALGLDFWEGQADSAAGAVLEVCPAPGQRAFTVIGRLPAPGKALDVRLKYSRWLQELERRGGKVIVQPIGVAELDALAPNHELVLVTAGKGELSRIFERDAGRSPHRSPPRNLASMLLEGYVRPPDQPFPPLHFILAAGHGEFFSLPYFHRTRGLRMAMLFEAIPGQGLDRFTDVKTGQELVGRVREVVHRFVPWLDPAVKNIEVVDEASWFTGAFTPTVRQPVARLPGGARVMGLGDTVILNDPIAGQGLNNASHMAHAVTEAILEHGGRPFTEDWMRQTFEAHWEREGQYRTMYSNMLLAPPLPHVLGYLGAASQRPALADEFVRGFGTPSLFWPWILSPEQTQAHIQQSAAR